VSADDSRGVRANRDKMQDRIETEGMSQILVLMVAGKRDVLDGGGGGHFGTTEGRGGSIKGASQDQIGKTDFLRVKCSHVSASKVLAEFELLGIGKESSFAWPGYCLL
jgi:hypothetical protein